MSATPAASTSMTSLFPQSEKNIFCGAEFTSTPKVDRKRKVEKIDAVDMELLKLIKRKNDETPQDSVKNEPNDPDMSFLMSLLPHFKRMTSNQKLRMQIEILQMVEKVTSDDQNLTGNAQNSSSAFEMQPHVDTTCFYQPFDARFPYEGSM